MPVSVASQSDPFRGVAPPLPLRVPQARVLAVLAPERPDDPPFLWPVFTRAVLAERVGYTALSGSLTRALNGTREGSSSGDAHPGLLALGYVVEEEIDVCGRVEVNYRATTAGCAAYRAFLAGGGVIPPCRDKASSVNTRRGYNNPHIKDTTSAEESQ